MNVKDHFEKIEKQLNSFPLTISVKFQTEVVDIDRGYYKAKAKFVDGSELHLFEYLKIKEDEVAVEKYRYHYQGSDEELIKRWDNSKHYPNLDNFPEHIHTREGVKARKKPSVKDILTSVMKEIE